GWVKDKANEVPVLSSLITTEEEAAIEEYEELLSDRDAQIEELEQLTEDQQFQLDELEQELLYYENNYESLEDISAEASEEEESQTEAQITISSSFANMDNEQAAAI